MAQKNSFSSILLMTSSFVGGIAAGLLFSSKSELQNRNWLNEKAVDLSNWIFKQGATAQYKGQEELQKIRNNVQQGIRHNVPDLYEATDQIDLGKRGNK